MLAAHDADHADGGAAARRPIRRRHRRARHEPYDIDVTVERDVIEINARRQPLRQEGDEGSCPARAVTGVGAENAFKAGDLVRLG
jgi:hypothetical protein